jgi:hypothetical protein
MKIHPVKQQLDEMIEHFRQYAEKAQFRRHIDERMFLFGIEIGRRRLLKPQERLAYLKTFWLALGFLVVDEITQKTRAEEEAFRKAYVEAADDWLRNSHVIGRWLENERKRHKLPDFKSRWQIDPETRRILVIYLEGIADEWPEVLARDQIDAFIDRLENPLDRA